MSVFAAVGVQKTSGAITPVINFPVVAAPAMRDCPTAGIKDLGLWDDAMRFENLDIILLRKQETLFSYSLVTGDLKKVLAAPYLAGTRFVDAITWGKRQWVFCQGGTATPFAIDLPTAQRALFKIPGVTTPSAEGPAFRGIINSGGNPGTIIEIEGDNAEGWPRNENRPLYYWMDLNSAKVVEIPTAWDLNYFSADQGTAVFQDSKADPEGENWWKPVDMATGGPVHGIPDRTKGFWSMPLSGYSEPAIYPWRQHDYRRHVWQLRTPQTSLNPRHPDPGEGHADDKFAGLIVDGVQHPLAMPYVKEDSSPDARVQANFAVFSKPDLAAQVVDIWATRLDEEAEPELLGENYGFEMLGEHRCTLFCEHNAPPSLPQVLVYNADSKTAWNVLEGTPFLSEIAATLSGSASYVDNPAFHIESGGSPMISAQVLSGFGSADYPAKVFCFCSTSNIVPANIMPLPERHIFVLLTADGSRYQINLPEYLCDSLFAGQSWLHNSGKLILARLDSRRLHLYVVDLRQK